MRAAATVVLRAGGASEAASRATIDAVRRAGAADYDISQLNADLSQPAEAGQRSLQVLATQLAPEVLERYLAEAVWTGLADGPLMPMERDSILWLANTLGMTPAHATGVITTVEQSGTAR